MNRSRMDYPPQADAEDQPLFDQARSIFPNHSDWRSLSSHLSEIARTQGMDLATAGWCDAIRNAEDQIDFAHEIERAATAFSFPAIADPPTILLIRGAFFGQHEHTGADGERIIRIATEMGWPVEVAPIQSFGSLETNAGAIIEHLLKSTSRRIVIVSLSKGSADVVTAFHDPRAQAAMSRVCGWVSLSGITTGTPLVEWLRSHPLRTIAVHLLLWSRRQRFRVIDQIGHASGPLVQPIRLPPHIRAIHVVGCPTRRHLRHPWAAKGYERVAPLGPTDGGGILLSDLARLPGNIYPVWGADHYLQPEWDVTPLIRSVLLHAAQSEIKPKATPTTRSKA